MTHIQEQRQFGFERLVIWQLALEVLVIVDAVARELPRPYGELADRLRQASLSVVANLAEGVGKDGKDQQRFFRIARGSACETGAIIEADDRHSTVGPRQHVDSSEPIMHIGGRWARPPRTP